MSKRILITGGLGFIGSHLAARLLREGNFIDVVDDLSSAPLELVDVLTEINPDKSERLTISVEGVADYARNWHLHKRYQEIYHLASPVGPAGVLRKAGMMAERITTDTNLVSQLALQDGAKLVDVSTSEVYGGGVEGLCSEIMPKHIQADATIRLEYAVAKLAAEIALLNACKVTALHACIVRPFNVAGPRQSAKGGFVVPRFIWQAMNGKPLTVFGDGTQVRAFTHVDDIVDGLIRVMESGTSGEVYNLGNPANRLTVNRLAHLVKTLVCDVDIERTDGKTVFGRHYAEAHDKYPDATKAMTELEWMPTRSVEQVIRDTHTYLLNASDSVRAQLSGENAYALADRP